MKSSFDGEIYDHFSVHNPPCFPVQTRTLVYCDCRHFASGLSDKTWRDVRSLSESRQVLLKDGDITMSVAVVVSVRLHQSRVPSAICGRNFLLQTGSPEL